MIFNGEWLIINKVTFREIRFAPFPKQLSNWRKFYILYNLVLKLMVLIWVLRLFSVAACLVFKVSISNWY